MPKTKKTDNQILGEKVEIRKRICGELKEPLRILDLFAGEGKVWGAMNRHFTFASYTPIDQQEKQPGIIRMKITPRTVSGFDVSQFNVIDIDCYGDPWEIWETIAGKVKTPTAVFWTFGHLGMSGGGLSYFLRETNGIPRDWEIPTSPDLAMMLGRRYFLSSMAARGARIAVAVDHPSISYYGALVCGG